MVKDLEIEFSCPICYSEIKIKAKQMRSGNSTTCPYCKSNIQFTGDDGSKVQKSLNDFEKQISKINMKLKF